MTKITFTVARLQQRLSEEFKMEAIVEPLETCVTFLGTELECYRLAYKLKHKDLRVCSVNDNGEIFWSVNVYDYFKIEFAQLIVN